MFASLIFCLVCLSSLFISAQDPFDNGHSSQDKLPKENGFVITNQTYKQGFSAYIGTARPKFITSDSLLMAYCDLLERSIADEHLVTLTKHRELITKLIEKLPKNKNDPASATTRLLIGTAHRILFGKMFGKISPLFTEEEQKIIEQEAKRVETSTGNAAPSWWIKDKYIPYSRFTVPSPWDKNPILKQYYRYTQWMMSMPFDFENEHHEKTSVVLKKVIQDAFISRLSEVDTGLFNSIAKKNHLSEVEALIHYPTTPDKFLLNKVLETEQSFTSLTKTLGVSFGNKLHQQNPRYQTAVTELKNANQPLFNALCALNLPIDKRAPKLFSTKAWQRKQLNTTLGAWAEYRHAIGITQTTSAYWLSASIEPVGFIEPVPEFFQALGLVTEELARTSLETQKSKRYNREFLFALTIEDAIAHLEKDGFGAWIPDQFEFLRNQVNETEDDFFNLGKPAERKLLAQRLGKVMQNYWNGETEAFNTLYTKHGKQLPEDTITPSLQELAILCYRLEAMSRKQLARKPWTKTEEAFIQDYGAKLGSIMHYFGNSYKTPRDDAPSIIQIAHLGSPAAEQILLCGNARPRQLLIHYPDHTGKLILCQGAVYGYREIISDKPITDKAWRKSCTHSKSPTWLTPITNN